MQDIPTVLGDVIERNARYFPGKTAVVCEERRVTYSEFAARVRKFANALASGGLNRRRASPSWRRTAWNISRRSAQPSVPVSSP